MADITVIGSFVMDLVASVDEFPAAGQTILGNRLNIYPGGKGANQCIAAARLGGKSEMIGMLGDDAYGKVFLELLKKERIIHDKVFISKTVPTAIAQVQINRFSENKIVVIPSANFEFGKIELRAAEDRIKNSKIVIAQMELRSEITDEIICLCDKLGVPLMLNPAPARKIDSGLYNKITYFTPNETELAILSGMRIESLEDVYKAAGKLLSFGVKNVITTLGSKGALIANSDGMRIIEGFKVKAVDTVAAGDSFNGALATALTGGKPLDDAVRFANSVGAYTVTKHGAIPSLPNLDELNSFLQNYHLK